MKKDEMDFDKLINLARAAREKSYCPYSGKSVGAALLSGSGKIFTGANIENSAFSPSVCAERVALFSAVHNGERDFLAIAISGGEKGSPASGFTPCGVCRQVMSEFSGKDLIILTDNGSDYERHTLGELLPHAFGGD